MQYPVSKHVVQHIKMKIRRTGQPDFNTACCKSYTKPKESGIAGENNRQGSGVSALLPLNAPVYIVLDNMAIGLSMILSIVQEVRLRFAPHELTMSCAM